MPERIYKLQPDRTMALRGFDDLGAAAALHSATPTGFKVSGVFRDPADFAVLMLWDADNVYEHARLRYLPDMNFSGLTLQFDVHYSGLMPLESQKYPTIDWPYLDAIAADGARVKVRIADHAVKIAGTLAPAECSFTVEDNGLQEFDRLTLWFENQAFDYIVPKVLCGLDCAPGGLQAVRVKDQTYTYAEQTGDTAATIAAGLAALVNASTLVSATSEGSVVWVRAKLDDGAKFQVSKGGAVFELQGVGACTVAFALAAAVDASAALSASATGATIRIVASASGSDGNHLSMQAVAKNPRLQASTTAQTFTGGVSDATWRVTLDFAALGLASVRQMWLTFAPPLAVGAAFEDSEWEASFTHWSVTGPEDLRKLSVAGPRSVRVEETDRWCFYTGTWTSINGFYSDGVARMTGGGGSTVRVTYACPSVHEVYIATTLGPTCGTAQVRIDGGPATQLGCFLDSDASVNTRRRIATALGPGEHTVLITASELFYFDFLEAVVASDVPDALPANPSVSPALDYSTDHTYKLPPARIHWNFDRLGFAAPLNEYIGVFWWNQRRRSGSVLPEVRIQFGGNFVDGDKIFVRIGDFDFGKSVFPADTLATIVRHYVQFINGNSVGVWARADGNSVAITGRSPKPAWRLPISVRSEVGAESTGTCSMTGSLLDAQAGVWEVDPAQEPVLNRGARDWHADMFRECKARNREITVAASMELVNPPAGFAAKFPNGQDVVTSVGFGELKSTHCRFGSAVREYQSRAFEHIAELQAEAGLTPSVQFGEFLWWFFADPAGSGMAYADPDTVSAAQIALGRPLHPFLTPVADPHVNDGADALFLRNRLRDHVSDLIARLRTSYPGIRIEVLFPYDVNHPVPSGVHSLGGALNRFVNLPVEWERQATSGFDRLKTEALDFGAWSRDLDLAKTAFLLPISLGWEPASLRHLAPVFRPGYAWEKEVAMALAAGIPVVNLWAWDHVGLYRLNVTPTTKGRSIVME